jgi:hypothetical protein
MAIESQSFLDNVVLLSMGWTATLVLSRRSNASSPL